ncbi:MAG TPA: PilZ domain-containing protein [Stenomitos sp.]
MRQKGPVATGELGGRLPVGTALWQSMGPYAAEAARPWADRFTEALASCRAGDRPVMIVYLWGDWSRIGARSPHPYFLSALMAQALRPCDLIIEMAPETFLLILPGVTAASAPQTVQRLVADLTLLAPELALPRSEMPIAMAVLRRDLGVEAIRTVAFEMAAHTQLGPIAFGAVVLESPDTRPSMPLVPDLPVWIQAPDGTPLHARLTHASHGGFEFEVDDPSQLPPGSAEFALSCELPCDQLHWHSYCRPHAERSGTWQALWPERIDQIPRRRSVRHAVTWELEFGTAAGFTLNLSEGGFNAVIPTGAAAGVDFRWGRLLPPEEAPIDFMAQIVRNVPHRSVGKRLVHCRFIRLEAEAHRRLAELLTRAER